MRPSKLHGVVAVLSLLLGSGCAFGITHVPVEHSPLSGGAPPRGADLRISPFQDLRPAERRPYIGAKRNGYGMVLGHLAVPPGETLGGILASYFAEALTQAGYRVVVDGSGPPPPPDFDPVALVEGDVMTFWLDLFTATWHNVDVVVRLRDESEEVLWEGRYKGDETNVLWLGLTSEFQKVIRQALDEALVAAVADFSGEEFDAQVRFANARRAALRAAEVGGLTAERTPAADGPDGAIPE